jgi:tRNA-dihydrouridine synthase 2
LYGVRPHIYGALQLSDVLLLGPETVDRSMIGTTRRVNSALSTIDFTRFPSNGAKEPRKDQKESIIYRLHPGREGRRLIFQLGTSDPDRAVAAARLVAGDVAGIDVNAGCPKPFSTSGGMGAALLRTPDKLCSILEALVKNITTEFEVGISVKIRLLETPEETEELVRKLVATGIIGLTVHCRTTPMRPREKAIREQLKMIADICREAGVACLMNGDVENREQALELMGKFGVDGAMIATAAETNSSCFRSQADGGLAPWKEVVEFYLKTAMEVENRWGNTKYLLGHLIPGKDPVYRQITASKTYTNICEILQLPHLLIQANEIDKKLELGLEFKNNGKQAKNKAQVALQNVPSVKRKRSPEPESRNMREVQTQQPVMAMST